MHAASQEPLFTGKLAPVTPSWQRSSPWFPALFRRQPVCPDYAAPDPSGCIATAVYERLRLRRFGVPDLDVAEQAVLAADAEFDLGLGGVADAGRLEIAGGLAVDGDAHLVADGLDDERVPFARFELGGKVTLRPASSLATSAFLAGSFFIS